jgi:hypothetical protein
MQFAWSTLKSQAFKDIKAVRLYYMTNGKLQPFVDVKTDYDASPPGNRPDVQAGLLGADWDISDWDVSDWAAGELTVTTWNGCAAKGNVVAVRVTCDVLGSVFRIKAADILYEVGSLMG